MDKQVFAFALVSTGILITPGADFALVLRNAMRDRSSGLLTAAGISAGLLLHGCLAVFGLAAALVASPFWFTLIQTAGGVYLVLLGARILWEVWSLRHIPHSAISAADDPRRSFRQGFLTNATNPKTPLLFLSLLPQFVPDGAAVMQRTAVLGLIAAALGLAWFSTVALIVNGAARVLNRPRVKLAIDSATGVALSCLGVFLLSAHLG